MRRFDVVFLALVFFQCVACAHRSRPNGPAQQSVPTGAKEAAAHASGAASALSGPVPQALRPTRPPRIAAAILRSPKRLARVRIAAVGDVIAHGDVLRSAAAAAVVDESGASTNNAGFDALFDGIRQALRPADLVFANLETPIAPRTGRKTVAFFFNAPPDLLAALKRIGVRLVSLANNHIYDQKRKGLVETLARMDASGLIYAGAGRNCKQARQAKLVEAHGIKLAFLASSTLYNHRLNRGPNKPCAFEFDERRILEEVAAARQRGAEMVILSMHWGGEYLTAPRQSEVELAHRLLEGGVDVLLGHHPHVLQPVEVYRASDGRICLVAYSLGNFVSNQSRFYVHGVHPERMGNPRDGAVLNFSIVRTDYGEGLVTCELADLSIQPLWTDNNALDRVRDKKLQPIIRVVSSDRVLAGVQRQLVCAEDADEKLRLTKRLQLIVDRRRLVGRVLGEDLIEPPPAIEASEIVCSDLKNEKKPFGSGSRPNLPPDGS